MELGEILEQRSCEEFLRQLRGAQPGEEEAQGGPSHSLQLPERRVVTQTAGDRMKGHSLKLC